MSLTVLVIPKLKHQLVASLGVLPQSETALFDTVGKTKIGQGWRDDMESRSFASILLREQR